MSCPPAMAIGASVRRRLPLALVALAVLAIPVTAAASPLSKVVTVRPATLVHMSSSDIYCTVLAQKGGSAIACFQDPGGPTSSKREGYAIAASDAFAAAEPTGSNVPVVLKHQPSLTKVPAISGGTAQKKIVEMGLNDLVAVGGTHMALIVTTAKGGGNAIGVVYLDAKNHPIVGSYTSGISDHYVSIVQVVSPTKTVVTYRHAVG